MSSGLSVSTRAPFLLTNVTELSKVSRVNTHGNEKGWRTYPEDGDKSYFRRHAASVPNLFAYAEHSLGTICLIWPPTFPIVIVDDNIVAVIEQPHLVCDLSLDISSIPAQFVNLATVTQ
jgi:hypothetical protein